MRFFSVNDIKIFCHSEKCHFSAKFGVLCCNKSVNFRHYENQIMSDNAKASILSLRKNVIFPRNLACCASTSRSIFVILRISLYVTIGKLQIILSLRKMSFFREIWRAMHQQISQFSSFWESNFEWKFWKYQNNSKLFRIFRMTKIDRFVELFVAYLLNATEIILLINPRNE